MKIINIYIYYKYIIKYITTTWQRPLREAEADAGTQPKAKVAQKQRRVCEETRSDTTLCFSWQHRRPPDLQKKKLLTLVFPRCRTKLQQYQLSTKKTHSLRCIRMETVRSLSWQKCYCRPRLRIAHVQSQSKLRTQKKKKPKIRLLETFGCLEVTVELTH